MKELIEHIEELMRQCREEQRTLKYSDLVALLAKAKEIICK